MRLLLIPILLFFSTCAFSQYEKGNWWLSAASGAPLETNPFANRDLLSPGIRGGVFVADRWLLGAGVSRPGYDPLSLFSESRVTPFIRRYFPSLKQARLHYYAEVGLGTSLNYQGVMPQVAIGLEYQLASGIMLNGNVSGGLSVGDGFNRVPSALGLQVSTSVLFGGLNRPEDPYNYFLRKGDFLLDGSLGNLTFGWREGDLIIAGNLTASAGYMLTDQLMLEGRVGLQFNDFTEGPVERFTFRDNNGFVSLGLRQYFNPGGRFQPYIAGAIRYDFWSYDFRWNEFDVTREDINFGVGGISAEGRAGFLYFLKRNVALDFNLGYRNTFGGEATRQGGQLVGNIGMKLFFGQRNKKKTPNR